VGATALVAACTGTAPTNTPAPAAKPTEAPKPAAAAPTTASTTAPAAAPTQAPAAAATKPAAAPAAAPTTAPTTAPAAAPKPAAKGPVELVFSNWNDDTYGRFREEEKVKLFNEKYPDIKINLRLFSQNYNDTLITQIAAGQGADVFRLDVPDMYPFADQGTIPDLTPRMMDKDNWYSLPDCKREFFDMLRYRGKFYGLTIGADSNAVEYNGSLFDEAKVPRPPNSYTEGWKPEALLEAAKKLTKREGDTPVQYGINTSLDAWHLAGLIWAWGGQTLSDDLTKLMWDQEPALKAIQFMADLVNVHKVAPAPSGGDAKTFAYKTGKVGVMWSYPSQLTYRFRDKLPWDWQVAPEPQSTGTPHTSIALNMWTLNAKSKNPDEAWLFGSFFAGPIATRVDAELGWGMPTFKSLDETYYKRILKDYPNKNTKPGIETLQFSKGWYDPHMQPKWAEAERKHITPVFDEVMLGKKSAADAVKEFKPQVDKLLKEGAAKLKG
jgi:multiple sugar transport system substrate-binding protein